MRVRRKRLSGLVVGGFGGIGVGMAGWRQWWVGGLIKGGVVDEWVVVEKVVEEVVEEVMEKGWCDDMVEAPWVY